MCGLKSSIRLSGVVITIDLWGNKYSAVQCISFKHCWNIYSEISLTISLRYLKWHFNVMFESLINCSVHSIPLSSLFLHIQCSIFTTTTMVYNNQLWITIHSLYYGFMEYVMTIPHADSFTQCENDLLFLDTMSNMSSGNYDGLPQNELVVILIWFSYDLVWLGL